MNRIHLLIIMLLCAVPALALEQNLSPMETLKTGSRSFAMGGYMTISEGGTPDAAGWVAEWNQARFPTVDGFDSTYYNPSAYIGSDTNQTLVLFEQVSETVKTATLLFRMVSRFSVGLYQGNVHNCRVVLELSNYPTFAWGRTTSAYNFPEDRPDVWLDVYRLDAMPEVTTACQTFLAAHPGNATRIASYNLAHGLADWTVGSGEIFIDIPGSAVNSAPGGQLILCFILRVDKENACPAYPGAFAYYEAYRPYIAMSGDLYLRFDDTNDIDGDGIVNDLDDDVDGDGYDNEYEIAKGTDPYDPDSFPPPNDQDGDGIPDGEDDDIDGDGLLNEDDPDADGDGWTNEQEERYDTSPNDPTQVPQDLDGDLIPDEYDPDMDGDGVPNAQEEAVGTDPRDPASYPTGTGTEPPGGETYVDDLPWPEDDPNKPQIGPVDVDDATALRIESFRGWSGLSWDISGVRERSITFRVPVGEHEYEYRLSSRPDTSTTWGVVLEAVRVLMRSLLIIAVSVTFILAVTRDLKR